MKDLPRRNQSKSFTMLPQFSPPKPGSSSFIIKDNFRIYSFTVPVSNGLTIVLLLMQNFSNSLKGSLMIRLFACSVLYIIVLNIG